MTRVIAGPFNRVEGDLEVALDIQDGVIARAEVTTTPIAASRRSFPVARHRTHW